MGRTTGVASDADTRNEGKSRVARPNFAAIRKVLKKAVERGEVSQVEADQALERLGSGRKPTQGDATGRREDILAAAIQVFASKGYHAATLQDVAEKLSLTRPAFYYYFKSKQEILEAICIGTVEAADEVIRRETELPAQTCEQALRRTLLAYTTHIAESETTTIMWRNFGEMSEALQKRLTARRRAREQRVLDLVVEGKKRGEFDTPEPTIATLAAFETLNSLHNWFDKGGRLSVEDVGRVLVNQVLHGLVGKR